MAYLNFGGAGFAAAARDDDDRVSRDAARFTALEWRVIAIAERDPPSSLRERGRIARAVALLIGGSGERRLAGARLEALRRFAVLAWHRDGAVPPSEAAAFRAAGFSAEQADALLASIAGRRAGRSA